MAVVFYGLAGEGRGHATRGRAIIEHLRRDHEVVVLTFGHALEVLAPLAAQTNVELIRVPGLHHQYIRGQVSQMKTALLGAPFLLRMGKRANRIARHMERRDAALVISDFEPLSATAARRVGIPWISIDHQRMLGTCDLKGMGPRLRLQAAIADRIVRSIYGTPDEMLVSGFHLPPLRKGLNGVEQAGVLLRNEVLETRRDQGSHLVAYLRRNCPPNVLTSLSQLERKVHVYGLGERSSHGKLSFKAISADGFVKDLASSHALVTTAGNQLLGEALYLGKPVLAFPEPGNFEQEINGRLLRESGGGQTCHHRDLTRHRLEEFLERAPDLLRQFRREAVRGNEQIFSWLERQLPTPSPAG